MIKYRSKPHHIELERRKKQKIFSDLIKSFSTTSVLPNLERYIPMDDYTKANLDWWNEAATIHSQGEGYDVASFKAGKNRLHPLEIEEVGGVTGKKLLHLQCH